MLYEDDIFFVVVKERECDEGVVGGGGGGGGGGANSHLSSKSDTSTVRAIAAYAVKGAKINNVVKSI